MRYAFEDGVPMNAEMIEWTLLLLEWIRGQILEEWPESRLRGSEPDFDTDGYTIRFRENEDEYWMVIGPEVIRRVPVDRVESLLSTQGWVGKMRETGCLHIGTHTKEPNMPQLHPCPYTVAPPRPFPRRDL
jgi:hypothetical protein